MVLTGPIPGNFRTTNGLLGEVAFPHLCDVAQHRAGCPQLAVSVGPQGRMNQVMRPLFAGETNVIVPVTSSQGRSE